jgi:hypothetical protein
MKRYRDLDCFERLSRIEIMVWIAAATQFVTVFGLQRHYWVLTLVGLVGSLVTLRAAELVEALITEKGPGGIPNRNYKGAGDR